MVPIVTAVTISTAWTRRNIVGVDCPISPDQARWSYQIASANRGQISQLKAPAATRNNDQFRDRITRPVSPVSERPRSVRCQSGSRWVCGDLGVGHGRPGVSIQVDTAASW